MIFWFPEGWPDIYPLAPQRELNSPGPAGQPILAARCLPGSRGSVARYPQQYSRAFLLVFVS